jgi:hypothetical protein
MRAPTPKSRWVKAPVRDNAALLSGVFSLPAITVT